MTPEARFAGRQPRLVLTETLEKSFWQWTTRCISSTGELKFAGNVYRVDPPSQGANGHPVRALRYLSSLPLGRGTQGGRGLSPTSPPPGAPGYRHDKAKPRIDRRQCRLRKRAAQQGGIHEVVTEWSTTASRSERNRVASTLGAGCSTL
jgi:hypothetical protein